MGLQTEDHFPGDHLEPLDENLDLGNELADEELDDETTEEPGGDAGGDDSGDGDADADSGDDPDGDADQESGDTDAGDEGADADKPAEPAPPKSEKGPVIPKARLDQELRKRRVAEQRAQELEQEIANMRREQAEAARPKPITAEQIKAKMAEANEALIAGDTSRAAELQAELLGAIAAPVERAAPAAERDLVAEVEARMEFKATLEAVNERFPELDENSELFNEELSQEAVDLQRSYMGRGFTLAEATRKAAEAVAKLNDLDDRKAVAPAISPKASVAHARQQQKTQEKIAKATKAPPALTGRVDNGGDVAFDVFKASEDELMALPKAALDRLLGNSL